MKEMKMASAFISYATDASTKAKQVSGYLAPLPVDTFVFEKDSGGDVKAVPARIRREIKRRDAVILILSVKSRDSAWVSHELGLASGMGKRIFVFKTAHNLELPDYLDEYQVIVLDKLEDLDSYFGPN